MACSNPELEHTTQIRVRYQETDQMGYAYHSNYLIWFEICRTEIFDMLGWSYKNVEKDGFLFPVLESNISYKKPAHFDDRLAVYSELYFNNKTRFRVHYKVIRDRNLLATGMTMHAFVREKNRKPCKPPAEFIQKLSAASPSTAEEFCQSAV